MRDEELLRARAALKLEDKNSISIGLDVSDKINKTSERRSSVYDANKRIIIMD